MPATATFSYGQRGKRADLSELLLFVVGRYRLWKMFSQVLR
jgi:hypothetical protein